MPLLASDRAWVSTATTASRRTCLDGSRRSRVGTGRWPHRRGAAVLAAAGSPDLPRRGTRLLARAGGVQDADVSFVAQVEIDELGVPVAGVMRRVPAKAKAFLPAANGPTAAAARDHLEPPDQGCAAAWRYGEEGIVASFCAQLRRMAQSAAARLHDHAWGKCGPVRAVDWSRPQSALVNPPPGQVPEIASGHARVHSRVPTDSQGRACDGVN